MSFSNEFNVERITQDTTAQPGQHLVGDGQTVTLPSPSKGDTILVSSEGLSVEVSTSSSIEGEYSSVSVQGDTLSFISDGSNWFILNVSENLYGIPDSATNQYIYSLFTTNEWPDEIGTKDITTVSGLTADSSAFGASGGVYAEASNNDHGLGDAWSIISGSNIFTDWSLGISTQIQSGNGDGIFLGFLSSSAAWIIAGVGAVSSIGGIASTGQPFLSMREGGGNRYDVVFNTTVDDGNATHIGFSKSANSGSGGIECYINGNEITDKTLTHDQGFGNGTFPSGYDLGYFAINNDNASSIDDNLTASFNEIVAYDKALSSSQWTDEFIRQTWS